LNNWITEYKHLLNIFNKQYFQQLVIRIKSRIHPMYKKDMNSWISGILNPSNEKSQNHQKYIIKKCWMYKKVNTV